MSSPPIAFNLGPLPWSDDTLIAAVWKDFQEARRFVDEHPGRSFADRAVSLQSVRRIFEGAAHTFQEELVRFHAEAHGGHLFRRNRRADLERYEHRFQELLYVFASSAMTLVDQARALSQKASLPEYEERVKTAFELNPRHRFIQELRVDLIHVTLHRPSWQLTSGRNEESTSKFVVRPSQLGRSKKYTAPAKQFVLDHPEGIDLGDLISIYSKDVVAFQDWLQEATNEAVGPQIRDYRRCVNRINAVSSRSFWDIILQQVVLAGKRDPYQYLDQHLTPEELAEVNSLPHRSKEQIDRIVRIVDEFGACDAELQEIIYRAFAASDA